MRESGLGYLLLLLLLLLALPTGALAGGRPPPVFVNAFDPIIQSTARDFGIEPELVKAVIAAESSFQPEAVSEAGAVGLMQLMPHTAAQLGVDDPTNPDQNIEGGTRYLAEMLERYGDVRRALAAYNAGPEAVDRFGGVPPYNETKTYLSRVLRFYRGYRIDAQPGKQRAPVVAKSAKATKRRIRPGTERIEMIRGTRRSFGQDD
jgi:soluble lytic murein transglycosylase-like protein